jgi:hypothetical protein
VSSVHRRSLPPTLSVSVSLMEKVDAQTSRPRVSDFPEMDTKTRTLGSPDRLITDMWRISAIFETITTARYLSTQAKVLIV